MLAICVCISQIYIMSVCVCINPILFLFHFILFYFFCSWDSLSKVISWTFGNPDIPLCTSLCSHDSLTLAGI